MAIDPAFLTIQTTSIVLVALLLRLVADGAASRFMAYWSTAWFSLALALGTLALSLAVPWLLPSLEIEGLRYPAVSFFCLLEYTCGFFLWAGCRHYASGLALKASDLWRVIVPALVALLAPLAAPTVQALFPLHAGLCGFFFLMSFLALASRRPHGRLAAVGLRLTQVALLGLVALFWWYAIEPSSRGLYDLHFSPIYDGLIVTLLGFGLVILATEFTQRELRERNRRLAEVTEQLAVAARTDPLTGLLNRRAFEAMTAERASDPFSGSVAAVDVNDLKVLNDRHGHRAGDAAIQLVARALRSHFRITDPIFRLGGDEFLVILEGGRASELACRLESVDRSLHGVRLPGVPGALDVNVAWGMADFDRIQDLSSAIHQADEAMYRNKATRKSDGGVGSIIPSS